MRKILLLSTILIFLLTFGINETVYSQANAGLDQEVCDDLTTLSANIPVSPTGYWQVISGSGTFADEALYNSVVTNLGSGENVFRWTDGSSFDDVTITNNSVTANAGLAQNICSTTTTLDGNTPSVNETGSWTFVNGTGTIINPELPNTAVEGLNEGTNTLRWTISNGVCSGSSIVTINNAVPTTAIVSPDQEICNNLTYISGNPPSVGIGGWSTTGSSNIVNPNNNMTVVNNLEPGTNQYTWTIDNEGCVSSAVITITNNSVVALVGDDINVCGSTAYLNGGEPNASNNESGTWTTLAGTGVITNPLLYNSEVTGLNVGANKFRWTISNGSCSDDDDIVITNDLYPANASIAGPSVICVNEADLLGNIPINGCVGRWSVYSGTAVFNDDTDPSTIISGLSQGENVVRWEITKNTCSAYDEVIITNNSVTASAGPDQQICSDNTALDGNTPLVGETGTWSILSGIGAINNPELPNTVVSGLSLGSNILNWTISNGPCSSSDNVIITNYEFNVSAGLPQTICGSETNLQGSDPSPGTGQWTVSGASGVTIENPVSNITTVSNLQRGSVYNFKWTVNNNGCFSADEVMITNNSVEAIAGLNQQICSDNTILEGNVPLPNETGSWIITSGVGIIQNPELSNTIVENLSRGENTLRWMISNSICSSVDEVTITNASFDAFAGSDINVCGNEAYLYAMAPSNNAIGSWTVVGGMSAGTFDNPALYNTRVTGINKGINYYRWHVQQNRCEDSDTVIVTNNSVIANAGLPQTICGSTTTLQGNTPLANETGLWKFVSGTGTILNPETPTTTIENLIEGVNTVSWTISNGTCSLIDQVTITNNSVEVNAGGDQEICSGNTALTGNVPLANGTGLWTFINGTGTIENPELHHTIIENLSMGENILAWSISNGICSSFDEVTITNNSVTASVGDDMVICTNYTTLVGNNTSTNETGLWTFVSGEGTIQNPELPNTIVENLSKGINIFSWELTNGICSATDQIIITSNAGAANAGQDAATVSESYELQAVIQADITGTWSLVSGSGNIENVTLPNSIVNDLEYGENIFLWSTLYEGCEDSDLVTINKVVSAGEDITLEGDTVDLNASPLHRDANGKWTIMDGRTATIENVYSPNTRAWNLSPGRNVFRWTVTLPNKNNFVLYDEVVITKLESTVKSYQTKVYPNPSSGIVNILSNDPLDNANIDVCNATGILCKYKISNRSKNHIQIDLSGNIQGMYFIKIKTDNSVVTKNIIIQ